MFNIGHRTTSYQGFFPILGFFQISKVIGKFIGSFWKQLYPPQFDNENEADLTEEEINKKRADKIEKYEKNRTGYIF